MWLLTYNSSILKCNGFYFLSSTICFYKSTICFSQFCTNILEQSFLCVITEEVGHASSVILWSQRKGWTNWTFTPFTIFKNQLYVHIRASHHPYKPFLIQCTTLLTAKQGSTRRTMLGCVILRHGLMTCDQPPLAWSCEYWIWWVSSLLFHV